MSRAFPEPERVESDEVGVLPSIAWIWRAVGWDGVLPLVVISVPILVRLLNPNERGAVIPVAVIVPITAAAIRAHVGWRQIARVCGGTAPLIRQLLLALAIVLLLLFEGLVGILTVGKGPPEFLWYVVAALYAGYLVLVTLALRPDE